MVSWLVCQSSVSCSAALEVQRWVTVKDLETVLTKGLRLVGELASSLGLKSVCLWVKQTAAHSETYSAFERGISSG